MTIIILLFEKENKKKGIQLSKKSKGKNKVAIMGVDLGLKIPVVEEAVMGVDLGLKNPAVAVTSDGKIEFFGNGVQDKNTRDKYKRKKEEINKKEERWMDNRNHKISNQIVDFAVKNKISIIRLENLMNARNRKKATCEEGKVNTRSFYYQLAKYIEIKAKKKGIKVEYVEQKYTSQKCIRCGMLNKNNGTKYTCKSCGLEVHRDVLAAINIISAPVVYDVSQDKPPAK